MWVGGWFAVGAAQPGQNVHSQQSITHGSIVRHHAATNRHTRQPSNVPQPPNPQIEDKGVRRLVSKLESVEGLLAKHPLGASLTPAELKGRLAELQRKQASRRHLGGCVGL